MVVQARALGLTDEAIIELSQVTELIKKQNDVDPHVMRAMKQVVREGYTMAKLDKKSKQTGQPALTTFLEFLKLDIVNDVCGDLRPLSSLDYTFLTAQFMMLFMEVEDRLRELRNPLYVEAYEKNKVLMQEKRCALTALVLGGDDDECMRVFAEEFDKMRSGFMNHIYWDDLSGADEPVHKHEQKTNVDDGPVGDCSVM